MESLSVIVTACNNAAGLPGALVRIEAAVAALRQRLRELLGSRGDLHEAS
jgi:hypothetical protein